MIEAGAPEPAGAQQDPDPARRARRAGWGLALAGLVVALVYGLLGARFNRAGDYAVDVDFFLEGVAHVRVWLSGEVPSGGYRGPLHSALVALGATVGLDPFVAARLLSALCAGALAAGTGWLVLARCGEPAAWAALALVVVNPAVAKAATGAGTDLLFAALATLAVVAALRTQRSPLPSAALAGLLAGLAALTRYNGFLLLGAIPGLVLFAAPGGRRRAAAALAVAPPMVVVGAYGAITAAAGGGLFPNRNYLNVGYAAFGESLGGWDAYWYGATPPFDSMRAVLQHDPPGLARYVLGAVPRHALFDVTEVLGLWLLPALVLGVAATLRQRPDRVGVALALVAGAHFAAGLLVWPLDRFSIPMVPFYLVLVGAALAPITAAGARRWGAHLGTAALALGLVATAVATASHEQRRLLGNPHELTQVAADYRALAPALGGPDPLVAARKPNLGYHLGVRSLVPPPAGRFRELAAWLVERDVTLLYVSAIEVRSYPFLEPLLDPAQAPPIFRPLVEARNGNGVLYAVDRALIQTTLRGLDPASRDVDQ